MTSAPQAQMYRQPDMESLALDKYVAGPGFIKTGALTFYFSVSVFTFQALTCGLTNIMLQAFDLGHGHFLELRHAIFPL